MSCDVVIEISDDWRETGNADGLIDRATAALQASGADAVVLLDGTGAELPGFRISRADVQSDVRSRWLPLVVDRAVYNPDDHRAEAEQYRDRIGDRLLRPEAVDPDKKHLIADDRQRAERVLSLPYRGRVLDVGTSDGTLLLEAIRRWDLSGAVGVDVATSAIEEANAADARDPTLAGRVSFTESFIEDLTFESGTFDTVSACETLEHIGPGQFPAAFGNLMRMLKAGGDLFMTVPNRYPDHSYERDGRARWAWPAHHQFFTELSVRQLLSPRFADLRFVPLYDHEAPGDSIYLICHARERR